MELPSNGTSFHDADLQSRARIGSQRNVGKWEEPVVSREEAKSKATKGLAAWLSGTVPLKQQRS